MRVVMIVLILLLMIPIASASPITGKVSLEVINPNYENNTSIINSTKLSDSSKINQNSLELKFIEQEKQKEKSNLITGQVISSKLSSQDNLKGLVWFLGIICFILLLYLIRKILKMR